MAPLSQVGVEHVDIPKRLREIADELEQDHIWINDAALVVDRAIGPPLVYYIGRGDQGPNAHLLLHVGASLMVKTVLDAKT